MPSLPCWMMARSWYRPWWSVPPRRKRHTPCKQIEVKGPCFFKHLHIFLLFSEKSMLSSQVTPTCRELSQSDGATGSWGKINHAAPPQPRLQRSFHSRPLCFQSRRGSEQRCGQTSGVEEKSQCFTSWQVSCEHTGVMCADPRSCQTDSSSSQWGHCRNALWHRQGAAA